MKLEDYLYINKLSVSEMAYKCGVSISTIHNILNERGDILLSLASKIVCISENAVTFADLLPPWLNSIIAEELITGASVTRKLKKYRNYRKTKGHDKEHAKDSKKKCVLA